MTSTDSKIDAELKCGDRFAFGHNWTRFLSTVDESAVVEAQRSLQTIFSAPSLDGKRFLDIGSGSGLFSLAACLLGARVVSFDYDSESVACAKILRERFAIDPQNWHIEQGSVLDTDYLRSLGLFDVVYSWGVLHHTGQMLIALANAAMTVRPGGLLAIAIYNDQRLLSRYWTLVKRLYNRSILARAVLIVVHAPYLIGARWIAGALRGRRGSGRGMSIWYDMLDWLGGYPFETARPEQVFDFYASRGFSLQRMTTCGGRHGCNEFVFRANLSDMNSRLENKR